MISEIEAEAKVEAKANVKAEKESGRYLEPDSNPWSVRGLIRYEEKDLKYADRKMLEAVKMSDPEEQRRHLQDVVELFANKYFVELAVEDLLEDADLDIVYVHRMLVESVDDPGPDLDYEEVMAEIFGEYMDNGSSPMPVAGSGD